VYSTNLVIAPINGEKRLVDCYSALCSLLVLN